MFSFSDVLVCLLWSFFVPAQLVLTKDPDKVWQSFEVTYSLPQWFLFAVALVYWIAIAVGVYFAAMIVGRIIGYLGKSATVGIGKVQLRLT